VQNEEDLISLEEAAKYLSLSTRRLKILVKRGHIPAYRLDKRHLRFKRSQLENWRDKFIQGKEELDREPSLLEKIKDFIYFHDFYFFSLILIILILYIIFRF